MPRPRARRAPLAAIWANRTEENRARQYEDFLKKFINPPPDAPTPSGFVYYLPNPDPKASSKPVSYDDCQHATVVLFEFKGESYAKLLRFSNH